jgi:hypothetical protein
VLSYPEDKSLHAMVLKHVGKPLEWTELADRTPGPGEARVRVTAPAPAPTPLGIAYLSRQARDALFAELGCCAPVLTVTEARERFARLGPKDVTQSRRQSCASHTPSR